MGHDLRLAFRLLIKTPGFAAAAIITLALGIGANTAMFTVLDSVLLRPLPYRAADRLVEIGEGARSAELHATSWPNLRDIRAHSRSFEGVAGYTVDVAILRAHDGSGKTVLGTRLTCNLIGMLGVKPLLGRAFADSDCARGAAPVVVLSENLWRDQFGSDRAIVGQPVAIGGVPHTVIGIMPGSFTFPEEERADATKGIWLPSRLTEEMEARGFTIYELIGRLRPGVSVQQAHAELETLAANIHRANAKEAAGLHFTLQLYRQRITNSVRSVFYGLAAALGLVLLIACANVANLELSRYLARDQELALRIALGGSRTQLLRELLAEGLLLSAAGAVAGLVLAWGILQTVQLLPGDLIPLASAIHLRFDVLLILAVLACFATLLSSLAPAMLALRTDPQNVLRGAGRGMSARASRSRLARGLIVAEVSIAAVLLIACSLLFRTLYHLENKDLGFAVSKVVSFTATPPSSSGYLGGGSADKAGSGAAALALYSQVLERLRALPGVERAALASSIPFDGVDMSSSFELNGEKAAPEQQRAQHALLRVVSGGYFEAMRTPLVRGRSISDSDAAGQPFVAVVNQAFAREYLHLANRDPIGQQLNLGGKDTGMEKSYTIVGVTRDAAQKRVAEPARPEMVLSYQQIPERSLFYPLLVSSATKYVLRTHTATDLSNAIRALVQQSAPGFAIDDLKTMQQTVADANFSQRLSFYLIAGFAGLAASLVVVGLYGVLAQLVAQRTREIGVRMALGATRTSILGLILRQGSLLIFAGLIIGIGIALAMGRTLTSFLFEVAPTDFLSYTAAALLLLVTGLAAALIPARRAATVNPIEALRTE
ncbi:MAG TPA: ABC transporter permease [Bryobacteraceae bacterium]|jgi:predicted permease|nr:ABC transporter permease [Bryobacteraceae bacterium]